MEVDQFTITNNPADVSEQCSDTNINPDFQSEEERGQRQREYSARGCLPPM